MEEVGLLCKLQSVLRRISLLTIPKLFTGSHLDYWVVNYEESSKKFCSNNINTFKYNAALVITGSIKGTLKF